ncbi:hypothetical protein BH23CHL5_BH23CHL5_04350 [soil metagenome]
MVISTGMDPASPHRVQEITNLPDLVYRCSGSRILSSNGWPKLAMRPFGPEIRFPTLTAYLYQDSRHERLECRNARFARDP